MLDIIAEVRPVAHNGWVIVVECYKKGSGKRGKCPVIQTFRSTSKRHWTTPKTTDAPACPTHVRRIQYIAKEMLKRENDGAVGSSSVEKAGCRDNTAKRFTEEAIMS